MPLPHCVRIGIAVLGLVALVAGVVLSEETGADPPKQPAEKAVPADPPPQPAARPDRKPKVLVGPVVTWRDYKISLGPWSWPLRVPDSLDLIEIADRIRGVFGMLAILAVAVYLSDNRRAISGR